MAMAVEHPDEGEIRRADDIGKRQKGEPRNLSGRQIGMIILVAVILLFAVLNLQKVSVDFGVTSVTMPLVFVIAGTGLLGFGAGYLVKGRRVKREHEND
jgi:uncharacterized integral membrane protein